MAGTVQQYFNLLTRTDHPAYNKDFVDVSAIDGSSPFNQIHNLVIARQLRKTVLVSEDVRLNIVPQTVTDTGISHWEETYFGFVKGTLGLAQRVAELLARINSTVTMNVQSVIDAAVSITGETPIVKRNMFFDGWILDADTLDLSTIFGGAPQDPNAQIYFVYFTVPIATELLQQLDERLTAIEKAGSRHVISARQEPWILDESKLDTETLLG